MKRRDVLGELSDTERHRCGVDDLGDGSGGIDEGRHEAGKIVEKQDAAPGVGVRQPHATSRQPGDVHGVEDKFGPKARRVAADRAHADSNQVLAIARRQRVEGDLGAVVRVDRVEERAAFGDGIRIGVSGAACHGIEAGRAGVDQPGFGPLLAGKCQKIEAVVRQSAVRIGQGLTNTGMAGEPQDRVGLCHCVACEILIVAREPACLAKCSALAVAQDDRVVARRQRLDKVGPDIAVPDS